MMTLRNHHEYFEKLTDWAFAEPDEARSRMQLVNDHRTRIHRITERMVLPPEFVS